MKSSRRIAWALITLLALELSLFLWKADHFFNGDSLFFFSQRVHSWSEVYQKFRAPDHLWQYRPLTFVIFSFILYPLFGMNPLGYNTIPLVFHMINTLLLYGILRVLLPGRSAPLAATFFFGIHSVAFYVTYGLAFLPDFSYSIFYLLSVLLYLKYCATNRFGHLALSLLCFILSLFCKEAGVTLPAVLFAITCLRHEALQNGLGSQIPFWKRLRFGVSKTVPFVIVTVGYLCFQWISKGGHLYAPWQTHPHNFEVSAFSIKTKYKYLKWAFNLPDGLIFQFEGWTNYLVALGVLVFAVPFVLAMGRELLRRRPEYWIGVLWFGITLSPVIFLRNLTMYHYLYVPVIGLALMTGLWLEDVYRRQVQAHLVRARVILLGFLLVTICATIFHNTQAVKKSWIAEASAVADKSLKEFQRLYPRLPAGAVLCIINVSSKDLRWFYDYGSLFRLFYGDPSLEVLFVDYGVTPPEEVKKSRPWVVLLYDGQNLRHIARNEYTWPALPVR